MRNEVYLIAPLSDVIVKLAVELTWRHPLCGYDAVYLATATLLNRTLAEAGMPLLCFVSADNELCEAAQAEGLSVANPNMRYVSTRESNHDQKIGDYTNS